MLRVLLISLKDEAFWEHIRKRFRCGEDGSLNIVEPHDEAPDE